MVLQAETAMRDGGPVLALAGEADISVIEDLRRMLKQQIDAGVRWLTIDAAALVFVDSACLTMLIRAARRLQDGHGGLVIWRPSPVVARLLELTGADRLLRVESDGDLHDS